MTGAVSSSRTSGISSVRLGGPGGKGGAASAAMNGIAANIASSITAELKLAVDPDGRRKPFVPAHDLYEVEEAANALTDALGGAPADRGRIALSLQRFAQEVAALMVARPESRSLEHVARAIVAAGSSEVGTVAAALQSIERTSDAISGKVTGGAL
jgi:hypothetical protein